MPELCPNGERIAMLALRKARDTIFDAVTQEEEDAIAARIDSLKTLLADNWGNRGREIQAARDYRLLD